jgi:hypothetical protein
MVPVYARLFELENHSKLTVLQSEWGGLQLDPQCPRLFRDFLRRRECGIEQQRLWLSAVSPDAARKNVPNWATWPPRLIKSLTYHKPVGFFLYVYNRQNHTHLAIVSSCCFVKRISIPAVMGTVAEIELKSTQNCSYVVMLQGCLVPKVLVGSPRRLWGRGMSIPLRDLCGRLDNLGKVDILLRESTPLKFSLIQILNNFNNKPILTFSKLILELVAAVFSSLFQVRKHRAKHGKLYSSSTYTVVPCL